MESREWTFGMNCPVVCNSCFRVFSKFHCGDGKCPYCFAYYFPDDEVHWIDDKEALDIANQMSLSRMEKRNAERRAGENNG